jgi:uncharacterized membrane protein YagU involved in acid resistance
VFLGFSRVEKIDGATYSLSIMRADNLQNVYGQTFHSMTDTDSPFKKMLQGAAAGLMATLPMTIFMQAAWLQLPAREMHPLPPRQITWKLLKQLGVHRRVSQPSQIVLTWLLHFLFGAMAGSLYGIMEERFRARNSVKGSLAGMVVWTGSYLGWIPVFGIMPPATKHPWRMNLLMIVAHLIWGLSLGVLAKKLNSKKQYIDLE